MRLVEAPLQFPNSACAVTGREDGELVDFQVFIESPTAKPLHLKREVVEEAGRFLGMVPKREVDELREGMAKLSAALDEMQETMNTYAEFEEQLGRKELTPA